MVSPELLRRYSFFAGLDHDQLVSLARTAREECVESGHRFFGEGEVLNSFYLVIEGAVSIFIPVTDPDSPTEVTGQLTGTLETRDVTVSTVGSGAVFGWSALIPPTFASAGARAVTPCRAIAFDCTKLLRLFDQDCRFGLLITRKAAEVIRQRLRDVLIESLSSNMA